MKTVLLVVYLALLAIGMSEFIHEYYVIKTRCNVTHDDVIVSSLRGMTHCGAICLNHEDCSGFRYSPLGAPNGGCHVYGGSRIASSAECAGGDRDFTDIYIQRDLATAENMTWIINKPSLHGNNANSTNTTAQCKNGGRYDEAHLKCVCMGGWIGPTCEDLAEDCSALQETGLYPDHGVYYVHPTASPTPFQVYCFMTSTFGLTQIQAHLSGAHAFNRSWDDYKAGFTYDTDLTNSWLGNDYIHYLSSSRSLRLLLDIKNGSVNYQFHHYNFVMGPEHQNYSVSYDTVSTTPDGMDACWPNTPPLQFSTYDRDNDGDPEVNCAAVHGAGWWFESENCTKCNLNGEVDPDQMTRAGNPSEAFLRPIDVKFSPEYILMALYTLP